MKKQRFAKGRRHVAGVMNKLEAEYEKLFLGSKPHGFEQIKLKLADKTYLTPDFWVLGDDDVLEFHETKGHWMDDARVKIKVAADQYPQFRFLAIRKDKSGWKMERFGPEDV